MHGVMLQSSGPKFERLIRVDFVSSSLSAALKASIFDATSTMQGIETAGDTISWTMQYP